MAYEVTKLVHGRPYRYRVRSERDAATGKVRNRWTYLGRADVAAGVAPVRARRDARAALLDALDRLFSGGDPNAVTAAAIAAEAGLAHGTFYRYFRSKQDATIALIDRVREEDVPLRDRLAAAPASRAEARVVVRSWAEAFLRKPERHGALIRALFALSSRDELLLARRREKREESTNQFRTYLRTITERGFADIDDPDGTALAILAMIDAVFRDAVNVAPLDDVRVGTVLGVIERAVFGRLD